VNCITVSVKSMPMKQECLNHHPKQVRHSSRSHFVVQFQIVQLINMQLKYVDKDL